MDGRQNRFGRSQFVGQGAIRVATYVGLLLDAIPAEKVLSHDKLEGFFLRTCRIPQRLIRDRDVDDFRGIQRRMERWRRGDVQLLPWALGRAGRSPLPWVERWWMWRDVTAALTPLSSVVLTVLVTVAPVPWGGRLGLVALVATMAQPDVLRHLARWRPRRMRQAARTWSSSAAAAAVGLGAVTTALVRMATRRHLLEWQPSSADNRAFTRVDALVLAGCSGAGVLVALGVRVGTPLLVVVASIWLVAPAAAWTVDMWKAHHPPGAPDRAPRV
ncbi:hypothetical protein MHY85_13695 [Cellulomonas sp. ACRRI]|uniref:hypothetical protein n=1 Tax=Cellulomonas sp. ACRRI TaxID=2918188 RepID=UPI001EF180E8|nr:hypothetical protein [Cellulomonas sp. ACRRI]MCG7287022.1 hypothetical protein [Cellulomonas sp. ACRRI]